MTDHSNSLESVKHCVVVKRAAGGFAYFVVAGLALLGWWVSDHSDRPIEPKELIAHLAN
jgi:hypothetical protein